MQAPGSAAQEDMRHVPLAELARGRAEDREAAAEGAALPTEEVHGRSLSTGVNKTQTGVKKLRKETEGSPTSVSQSAE